MTSFWDESVQDVRSKRSSKYRKKSRKRPRKPRLWGWEPDLTEENEAEDEIDRVESRSRSPSESLSPTMMTFPLLEQIASETSVEKLEAHAKTAESVINSIQNALQQATGASDASRLLSTIERVNSQPRQIKTVVGVVGDTGSGKSSIINALLDEEMLVPTNCMRACTAVITEISYNYSDHPNAKYVAEIEFITEDDWRKELSQLFQDLIDDDGDVVRDSTDSETEAGVSWAKIKAVYPQQTKEALAHTTVDTLANVPQVRSVLGKKERVVEADAEIFLEKMQKFIESNEKDGRRKSSRERKELDHWPLIKVVRIYVKADALSTGTVIVDLPGVRDSNAARAAVADKYLETCSSIWIVAPITRAVDDKTAQSLMGKGFKLQLKLDCKYDYLTFICSKTDEISIEEATKTFAKEEEVINAQLELEKARKDHLESKKKFEDIDDERRRTMGIRDELHEQLHHWQQQADNLRRGIPAQSYSTNSLKRKFPARRTKSLKKRRFDPDDDNLDGDDLDDDDLLSSDSDESVVVKQEDASENTSQHKYLTMDYVRDEQKRLTEKKWEVCEHLYKLDALGNQANEEKRRNAKAVLNLRTERDSVCIQGRNRYSKEAIQHDFARGLRESDQEFAIREDDELFDPKHDIRDYEKIASSFPVFCVSSRAYQKNQGRLKKDNAVQGFPTPENTGIPQLRLHAKKMTEQVREDRSRRYIKHFTQFVLTTSLWANDRDRSCLTEGEKRDQVAIFKKDLEGLERDLNKAARHTVEACRNILALFIFSKFENSIEVAAQAAIPTVEGWFLPRRSGGLAWNSMKSFCNRNGVHKTKSAGYRNLNEELAIPLKQVLANMWERAFSNRIPNAVANFPVASQNFLDDFHQNVKDRIPSKDHGLLQRSLQQSVNYDDIFERFQDRLNASQQEANRGFTPVIKSHMTQAYEACQVTTGKNTLSRMRDTMRGHVLQNQGTMFREATRDVHYQLNNICNELESELEEQITQSIDDITFDFESGIIGSNLVQASKAARADVYGILSTTDALFQTREADETGSTSLLP